MSNFNQESVLSVHHWTDTLFSFTTTRDPSFRFRNGEFTMIGLKVGEAAAAYSVASANYEDRLRSSRQGAGRAADLTPQHEAGRRDRRQPQGHRYAGDRNLEDSRNLYLIGTGTAAFFP